MSALNHHHSSLCTTANRLWAAPGSQTLYLYVSEGAGEMLEEDHGVMFFKLLEQPPPLLGRYGFTWGDITKKLFEALQGGSLSLVLIFLWCHLLAEGKCCNTQCRRTSDQVQTKIQTRAYQKSLKGCTSLKLHLTECAFLLVVIIYLLAIESGSFPCCRVLKVLLTASVRDAGVCIHFPGKKVKIHFKTT